jgi:hypothetical protein
VDIDTSFTELNLTKLQLMDAYSNKALRKHLIILNNDLDGPERCMSCWIHSIGFQHPMEKCTGIAAGYVRIGSKFKAWKSKFDLPTGMCFACCYPGPSFFLW